MLYPKEAFLPTVMVPCAVTVVERRISVDARTEISIGSSKFESTSFLFEEMDDLNIRAFVTQILTPERYSSEEEFEISFAEEDFLFLGEEILSCPDIDESELLPTI